MLLCIPMCLKIFIFFQTLYILYILTSQCSVVIIVPNELLIGIPFYLIYRCSSYIKIHIYIYDIQYILCNTKGEGASFRSIIVVKHKNNITKLYNTLPEFSQIIHQL